MDPAAAAALRIARRGLGAALLLAGLALAGGVWADTELIVSAAISLKDALADAVRSFEARHPGVVVRLNLGASGQLEKQIEAGAPVDVFLSAASRQMEELEQRGLIRPDTRVVFATNTLVVVTPRERRLDLGRPRDLLRPGVGRVVIGNPRTVPAGQYAEESLRTLELWARLEARIVFAENVRQALEYVARGEADAGIVYATDAISGRPRVRVAFTLPPDSHRAILYPAAVVRDARAPALAQAFVDFLVSREGHAALRRHGFEPASAP